MMRILVAFLWLGLAGLLPVRAAAAEIDGYGPYELGRSYLLDPLPEGLVRGADYAIGDYRMQTAMGLDSLTFDGQTYPALLTLYLHQGVLVCVEVYVAAPPEAWPWQVDGFIRELHEALLRKYAAATVVTERLAHDHSRRRWRNRNPDGVLALQDDGSNWLIAEWLERSLFLSYMVDDQYQRLSSAEPLMPGASASKL
jgi:hypothetical protein